MRKTRYRLLLSGLFLGLVAASGVPNPIEYARVSAGSGDDGASARIEALSKPYAQSVAEGEDWFLDFDASLALRIDTWGNFRVSPRFRQRELQAVEFREIAFRLATLDSTVTVGKFLLPSGLNRGFNPLDPSPLSFANPFRPDRKAVWGVGGETGDVFGAVFLSQGSLFLTEGPYRAAPAPLLDNASYGAEVSSLAGWKTRRGPWELEASIGYGIDPNPQPQGAGLQFPWQLRGGAGLSWTGEDWTISGELDIRREEGDLQYGWMVIEAGRTWNLPHRGATLQTLVFGSFLIGDIEPLGFDRLRKDAVGFNLNLDPNGRDVFNAAVDYSVSTEGNDFVFSPSLSMRLSERSWVRLRFQSSRVEDIPESRVERINLSVSHRF